MKGPYDDIMDLPHHVSKTRQKMSMIDRAAQFSPFAALTGYEASIQETQRLTDSCVDLDVDGMAMLDEKVQRIAEMQDQRPEITVTFFVPDERKRGGAYRSHTGRVKKIDGYEKAIVFEDGTIICLDRIYDIDSKLPQMEPAF